MNVIVGPATLGVNSYAGGFDPLLAVGVGSGYSTRALSRLLGLQLARGTSNEVVDP